MKNIALKRWPENDFSMLDWITKINEFFIRCSEAGVAIIPGLYAFTMESSNSQRVLQFASMTISQSKDQIS